METLYTSTNAKPLYRGTQIVWYTLAVIETLLSIRFFLRLFGANPEAGFTSFTYTVTDMFVTPFISVFGNTNVNGAVIEWGTLLATVIYWILAVLLVRLLVGSRDISSLEAASRLREERQ